jgi:DNA recombination protein RmuC
MTEIMLIILIILVLVNIAIGLLKNPAPDFGPQLKEIGQSLIRFDSILERTEKSIRDEFQRNRTEMNVISLANRQELAKSLEAIREENSRQLDEMRKTVDEKLQKTLNERLSQSFDTVGKQLQAVQEGLGEMKNLASDVGGLKKVLSNVKMRGGIGEIQLSMLLEQILASDQYEANVKTKQSSADLVEFAIKLPGRDEIGTTVWLPVDAKFPRDIYELLQEAYDDGDQGRILTAQKNLDFTIRKMAKDISEKYIDPPGTTDFGIMFLPFEGIYAEVVRKAALLEDLQRNYKIIVTGPTTLAAILNSLQMGFRTLAIQRRSSEVWQILGAVKKEFENFEGLMSSAQKNIQTGLNQLDDVMGRRTRAIHRKLKGVEALSETETRNILPELTENV